MHLRRFADAKPYDAPNHRGVVGLRLQGFEDGGPLNQWVGYSQFLPGGGAGPDATPFEKVYVVLDGEMTVIIGGVETVLGAMDSCTIAPGEVREIVNRSNHVCKMLVVLPYPPKVAEVLELTGIAREGQRACGVFDAVGAEKARTGAGAGDGP